MSAELALDRLLCARPELKLLAESVAIRIEPLQDIPFSLSVPGTLSISAQVLHSPHSATVVRHALEAAWLQSLGHPPPIRAWLAARCALSYAKHGCGDALDPVLEQVKVLAERVIPQSALQHCWQHLRSLYGDTASEEASFGEQDLIQLEAAWLLAQPVEELLCTGGDGRLNIQPQSGRNRYGCAMRPAAESIQFGSCTASTLSGRSYAAAEALRRRLMEAALQGTLLNMARLEATAIREGLLRRYGLTHGADAILAASGTDASLLAAQLAHAGDSSRPVVTILTGSTETGSGVPYALGGCAFGNTSAMGKPLTQGNIIGGATPVTAMEEVHLRSFGRPRDIGAIDEEVRQRVHRAVWSGCKVVLFALHPSKSGLVAPSRELIEELLCEYKDQLYVIVDACQGRISERDVQRYLHAGALVLLTGSKFFAGPSFCGVLFVPDDKVRETLEHLPQGLAAFSSRADWTQPPTGLAHDHNLGLLLRWAGALAEMDDFLEIPPQTRIQLLENCAQAIQRSFQGEDGVLLWDGNPGLSEHDNWSSVPTIFPFMVRSSGGQTTVLGRQGIEAIYRSMMRRASAPAAGPASQKYCHIGQPVFLGLDGENDQAVLRLAISSRHISAIGEADGHAQWINRIEHDAREALQMIQQEAHALNSNTLGDQSSGKTGPS